MTLRRPAPFVIVALLSATASHAQPIDREKAREAWQRVPDIVAAMNIGSGSR